MELIYKSTYHPWVSYKKKQTTQFYLSHIQCVKPPCKLSLTTKHSTWGWTVFKHHKTNEGLFAL